MIRCPVELGGEHPSKIIRCNIWGEIEVDALARAIIDTWAFQRLHYIRQTGMVYKVFPTARTTRFENAIGAYHVSRMILNRLVVVQPDLFLDSEAPHHLIAVASLCKNLGMGPFGHVFDTYLRSSSPGEDDDPWVDHDYRACVILERIVGDVTFPYRLEKNDISFIQALLCPDRFMHHAVREWFACIVHDRHDVIDAGKIDYLMRDTASTGMQRGFNIDRIINGMRVIDGRLCFCERVCDDLRMFLWAKANMFDTVYRHPKVMEFEAWVIIMLARDERLAVLPLDYDRFITLTDDSFLAAWITTPSWRSIETRVVPSPPKMPDAASTTKSYLNGRVWVYPRKNPSRCHVRDVRLKGWWD